MSNGQKLAGKCWVVWAMVVGLAGGVRAEGYELDWWVVSGGGVSSASESFEVDGTVGQTDVGLWESEGATLVGGFWAWMEAGWGGVLSIGSEGMELVICWPVEGGDSVLEVSEDLVKWDLVAVAPVRADGRWCVRWPMASVMEFFRLRQKE